MSATNINSPHDKCFKLMMSDPKIAQEFFEQYLPADIRSVIDLDNIKQQKDSFISDDFKQQIADLLFSAEFDGESGYIYVLVEHQSSPSRIMPFRILKYIVAIMDCHLKKTGKIELPIVYPIIFYSGKRNYNYSTDIFDLFRGDKDFAKNILFGPNQLIDLSKIPDEQLRDGSLYGIFACIMKNVYTRNAVDFLKDIIKDLRPLTSIIEVDYVYGILSYIVETYDI